MTNTPIQDKRRTPSDGRKVTFMLREAGFVPPFEQVTSVSVIPFTTDGGIVATVEKRGPDLPGGHVATNEENVEATARRESLEEAGITLGELRFVRAIESDMYGTAPEDLTYMVILTGIVDELLKEPEEALRLLMTVAQFKEQHVALDAAMMRELVDIAVEMTFGD